MKQNYLADLVGKTVLVTGATSGIGLEAAVTLARAGARTIIIGRNPAKTKEVLAGIRKRAQSNAVKTLLCDFASQAAVRHLAAEFRAHYDRLDILINNAGTVYAKRTLTEDGIEATFAINHLGAFLLTNLLLDVIIASTPARIVNVASVAHYDGTLDFNDLGFAHGYRIMHAYARSKLANVLFTRALAKRLEGTGVTVNAVHPGTVATHIWDGAPGWAKPFLSFYRRFFMLSSAAGAQTIVYLATNPEVEAQTGLYFEKNRPKEPSSLARDDVLAERLWTESARLTRLPPQ